METVEVETFWDSCPLIERVPGKVSGAPVLKGTRVPADTIVGNVEAHMELRGLSKDAAITATLKSFPTTPGGAETIRRLLAYQESHLRQLQP
jgi:uncharacterized protein (DUF433 family)